MSTTIAWELNGATLAVDLDASMTESDESSAEVTEHPVETGSAIGDHVKPANDTITVEGVITNTPLIVSTQMGGATLAPAALDLPGMGTVTVQRWSAPFDRVTECRTMLRALVKAGVPASLSRGTGTVWFDENLILTRFRVDRDGDTGESLNVSLDFKQLRVVSTSRVEVPAVRAVQPGSGRGTQPTVEPGSAIFNDTRDPNGGTAHILRALGLGA